MTKKLKIAVIGNGIIGSICSIYLSKKGYEVDCIGPDHNTAKVKIKKSNKKPKEFSKGSLDKFISPKFDRNDFSENKRVSDIYLPKITQNFFSLEIADDLGLAKYWGGNLALNALNEFLKELNLTKEEIDFIENNIPKLDIQKFYKKKFPNLRDNLGQDKFKIFNLQKQFEINSSILSIIEDECDIDNLPSHDFSRAIFGSEPINLHNCKRIKGIVERIEFNQKSKHSLTELFIDNSEKIISKKYNYVFIASGAIGSYRLIMKSLGHKKNHKLYNRIKHHPMLSTLTIIPALPYPKKHIGMSNLDLKVKVDGNEIFINFHPFESFLKTKYEIFLRNKKPSFIWLITFFMKFAYHLSPPLLWILRRVYIAAIYLPSDLSSSYIGYKNDQIKIIGGYRSDFEKYVMKKLWKQICLNLRRKKVFNLLIKPFKTEIGADFHYASTLVSHTNKKGIIRYKNKNTNVIVIDSSSSPILPTPNPTYYFLSRAIKLLRIV